MTTGHQLKMQGISDVLAADKAVHRRYADWALDVIEKFIAEDKVFTAEDVREAIPSYVEAHHANVLPAVFGHLSARGRIVRVGDYHSPRRSRRSGRASFWKGVKA